MADKKLSKLQRTYKNFFLNELTKFQVDSPAKLSLEQKREFFNNIRDGWKIIKAELTSNELEKKITNQESNYALLKICRRNITLEPKVNYRNIIYPEKEESINQIISIANIEQTDYLKIKFYPNNFFDQSDTYGYPVVKMPVENSYLKLPRLGRALGKGFKESDFHRAVLANFPNLKVRTDLHMAIPYFNKPYEPDIVLIDKDCNLYVDIEIDEPYDGYYRFPRHEVGKDDNRDLFFTESGWVVIRFTERQVHLQENECIAYIKDVLNSIYSYQLEVTSNCVKENQWDYQKAVRWEKDHYREKYLGIEAFGKQNIDTEIIVNVNEIDGIENNLDRTKLFKSSNQLDNIAFEDEAHKYYHPKNQTGNADYISVTTLIERFFPFDLDRYIKGKAKKEGRTKDDVLKEFIKNRDEAAEKGTYLHEQIENFLMGKDYDSNSKEYKMFNDFYDKVIVANGFEFVAAEKTILFEDYNIAGTVDALFKKPNSDQYLMVDWKRSKKLIIDGHPIKYGYGFALSELNHLDNSSYYKYSLQQNIYRYILQKKYGMNISSMNLIVLHEKFDSFHRIKLEPLKNEVEIIFKSINHNI